MLAALRDLFIQTMYLHYRPVIKMIFGSGARSVEAFKLKRRDLRIDTGGVTYATYWNRKTVDSSLQSREVQLYGDALTALPDKIQSLRPDDLIFTVEGR